MDEPKLSVVVPVYNEEDCIENFISSMVPVLERLNLGYEIIFSLDPSSDQTAEKILQARHNNKRIKLIEFSRRFGQHLATLGGMQFAHGDAVVVMDVDLQDPPELLEPMVAKWRQGFDVVYARRNSRAGHNGIYLFITFIGYRLIRRFSRPVKIPIDGGDFRLMSR